jgi:hypothetical protein
VKREATQIEKIILCLFPEMCEKRDNSIRENSIMFISRNVGKGREINIILFYLIELSTF